MGDAVNCPICNLPGKVISSEGQVTLDGGRVIKAMTYKTLKCPGGHYFSQEKDMLKDDE